MAAHAPSSHTGWVPMRTTVWSLRGAYSCSSLGAGEAEPLLLAAFKRFDPPKPITRNWHDAAAGGLVKIYEADEAAKYRATITVPPR